MGDKFNVIKLNCEITWRYHLTTVEYTICYVP